MEKEMKVLCGFRHPPTERMIVKYLESYGYTVSETARYSKVTIKDYLLKNADTDVVFLKEFLEGGERYSGLEISELTDECMANFVVIVRPQNKGGEMMKTLYAAGVLNAVFADHRLGVKPEVLARLAVKGRKRREAREYYKIDTPMPDYGTLSFEEYRDLYAFFIEDDGTGSSKIDRFLDLQRMVSPKQLARFIRNIPDKDREYLSRYEEYYDVMDTLRNVGAVTSADYKRPKGKLKKAVTKKTADKVLDALEHPAPETDVRPLEPDPVQTSSEFEEAPEGGTAYVPDDSTEDSPAGYRGSVDDLMPVHPVTVDLDEPDDYGDVPVGRKMDHGTSETDMREGYSEPVLYDESETAEGTSDGDAYVSEDTYAENEPGPELTETVSDAAAYQPKDDRKGTGQTTGQNDNSKKRLSNMSLDDLMDRFG